MRAANASAARSDCQNCGVLTVVTEDVSEEVVKADRITSSLVEPIAKRRSMARTIPAVSVISSELSPADLGAEGALSLGAGFDGQPGFRAEGA